MFIIQLQKRDIMGTDVLKKSFIRLNENHLNYFKIKLNIRTIICS